MSTATTRELPVKLTDAELRERAKELGAAIEDHAIAERQKKAAADDFKMQLEALDTKISNLGHIVTRGEEYRPVAITTRKDFERSKVETIRLDTNEVVDSRPMTLDEKQSGLFDDEESQEIEDVRQEKRASKRRSKKGADAGADAST